MFFSVTSSSPSKCFSVLQQVRHPSVFHSSVREETANCKHGVAVVFTIDVPVKAKDVFNTRVLNCVIYYALISLQY